MSFPRRPRLRMVSSRHVTFVTQSAVGTHGLHRAVMTSHALNRLQPATLNRDTFEIASGPRPTCPDRIHFCSRESQSPPWSCIKSTAPINSLSFVIYAFHFTLCCFDLRTHAHRRSFSAWHVLLLSLSGFLVILCCPVSIDNSLIQRKFQP